jgi:hypothetical protein
MCIDWYIISQYIDYLDVLHCGTMMALYNFIGDQ